MYEYLPKMVALLGGRDPMYRDMYVDSMDTAQRHLFYRPMTPDRADILFPGTVRVEAQGAGGGSEAKLATSASHLGCFLGGMLALGGRLVKNETHINMAGRMTLGCVWAYAATSTGVMPEVFQTTPCPDLSGCRWSDEAWEKGVTDKQTMGGTIASNFNATEFIISHRLPKGITTITDSRYILRPEAIESVFIMYRITGDKVWLERAWDMWQAIEDLTRTELAYSAVRTVHPRVDEAMRLEDSMESFWLGETLKYFYLIFSEPGVISLDEWVFNTEAHPFKRLR
jgi:mannosyl-oligosaccharide alpha-1,2-mannosidase